MTVNADDEDGDALSYEAIGGYASIAAGAEPNQIDVTPRALGGPFSFAVIVSDGCQVAMGDFVIGEVWDETTPPFIDNSDIWFEDITGTSVTVRWEKAWDDWSAIQDLEYKVVYALDPDEIDDIDLIELGGGTIAMDWTVDVDAAPIAGLTEGQQYYATVLVRDEYHNMSQYITAPFTMPDVTAPTTGGDISFSDITETSFTVSWDSASDNLSDLS
ncbi:MAG TPA: hypothetical protein PKH10_06625, partial [bacterium]|nr:hypothetical protein [bacterium]